MFDQVVDLIFGEFAIESGHAVFPFADDFEEFGVRFVLYCVRSEGENLQIFAQHGIAYASCAVTGGASLFVSLGCRVGQRVSGKYQRQQNCDKGSFGPLKGHSIYWRFGIAKAMP